jgi:hypothetical protein
MFTMRARDQQRQKHGAHHALSTATAAGRRLGRGRGWCAGEAGMAAALLAAANALGRPDWQRTAIDLALTATLPATDPMLCHGVAGVSHVLNRLYQITGEPALRARAIDGFRQLLAQPMPPTTYDPEWTDATREGASVGLLDGPAGVAVSLLSAVASKPPAWDGLLGFVV